MVTASPPARLEPVLLEGRSVRLEPLDRHHIDPLAAVGLDPEIWRWSPEPVLTRERMRAYVEAALDGRRDGTMAPFATVLREDDRVVGSTRFGAIDLRNRRVEIGWTWIAPPWQRTAVNTEAKLLMLAHAFDTLGCQRVELKTDVLNERSRRAIGRLGAREEGVFRKHMVTASGRVRDSVYFSIVDDEWPQVRSRLEDLLRRVPV
jgi:RimJ/RimL family protein N-acetyltransferase